MLSKKSIGCSILPGQIATRVDLNPEGTPSYNCYILMNLYILRHASAGTSRPNPTLDAKRPLDKEGKQHCLNLAHTLNALKITFDLIVSSPLKRALQTAQLIATETGYEAQILPSSSLSPTATYPDFRRLIEENLRPPVPGANVRENVLVVGHNPNLTGFLGTLIMNTPTDEGAPAIAAAVRLRKGSLARVLVTKTGSRLNGTLLGLLDPRTVRALYRTSTASSRSSTSRK
jgi:phosphohistidine phosphatase